MSTLMTSAKERAVEAGARRTQAVIDAFYKSHGPCCAGCDWWRWANSVAGECTRHPPNQHHDAAAGLGMTGCSWPRSTSNLTTRDHLCGDFVDTFEWPVDPLRARIQQMAEAL